MLYFLLRLLQKLPNIRPGNPVQLETDLSDRRVWGNISVLLLPILPGANSLQVRKAESQTVQALPGIHRPLRAITGFSSVYDSLVALHNVESKLTWYITIRYNFFY
jgi:hypothetical protein